MASKIDMSSLGLLGPRREMHVEAGPSIDTGVHPDAFPLPAVADVSERELGA